VRRSLKDLLAVLVPKGVDSFFKNSITLFYFSQETLTKTIHLVRNLKFSNISIDIQWRTEIYWLSCGCLFCLWSSFWDLQWRSAVNWRCFDCLIVSSMACQKSMKKPPPNISRVPDPPIHSNPIVNHPITSVATAEQCTSIPPRPSPFRSIEQIVWD
jgi:hypothetical protein